jgi:hypothetical protein
MRTARHENYCKQNILSGFFTVIFLTVKAVQNKCNHCKVIVFQSLKLLPGLDPLLFGVELAPP